MAIAGERDVGRVLGLHADDVVARIDMMDLAGNAAGEVAEQIQPGAADILDRHVALHRRVELVPFENVAEIADSRSRQRLRSQERRVGKAWVRTCISRW